METIKTAFGDVPLSEVLHAYEIRKQAADRKKAWLQTEAGKEYNRQKSKEYYQRHKEEIAKIRSEKYEKEREALIQKSKDYYEANREECIEKQRQYREAKAKARGEKN
jgi:hypothetical protein